jgi:imidazolonepropionase-like amidohydrolase
MDDMKVVLADLLVDANGCIDNPVIFIKDRIIDEVASKNDVDIPRNADVIDAKGKILMPGMIDCHVHFQGLDKKIDLKISEPFETRLIRATIRETRQMIDSGFTSVMDAGGLVGFHIRNAINEEIVEGPRIFASGRYISVTAGHGDTHYWPLDWVKENRPMGWWPADGRIADGLDECHKAVREQLRMGVDFIKICASGTGGKSEIEPWWIPQYTVNELQTMIYIAHSWKRKVMVHAHNSESICRSVKSGADIVTHCTYPDEEAIKLLKNSGAIVVPTMSGSYKMDPDRSFDNIKKLHEAGVTLALGTDTLGYPLKFGDNALEFEVYVNKMGLNEIEAIKIGTLNGAKAMGIKDLGTLEKGKIADIIGVNENPIDDIRCLQKKENIKLVMKEGKILKNKL